MEAIYVGIDVGTTAIKISAIKSSLEPVFEEQFQYSYLNPQPDWTEIDPETWRDLVFAGLKRLFKTVVPLAVKGIGITGQMHTIVFLDEQGQSVRPALMWNDHRTIEDIPEIARRLRQLDSAKMNAKIVSPGSPLANLLWVQKNEPANFTKIRHIMTPKDYLVFQLTGVYSTDYCDASTSSMYDFEKDTWAQEVFTEFSIDPEIVAPIYPAAEVVGTLTEEVQALLQIEAPVIIVTGTGDNVAAAIATGSFETESPILSLGTSGVVVLPDKQHRLKPVGKNVVAKLTKEDNSIITQGTVQAGAKTNSWFLEKILKTSDYQEEQRQIPLALMSKSDVLFLPHLNGEKTLYASGNLRGAFCNLSLETTRQEMYLAVLEGLAFGMRHLYEEMIENPEDCVFTIVGGGAKSQLWVQIFANVFQMPIKKLLGAGEAVQGAAMLVMTACKDTPFATNSEIVFPDNQTAQNYQEKYLRYLDFERALVNFTKAVN